MGNFKTTLENAVIATTNMVLEKVSSQQASAQNETNLLLNALQDQMDFIKTKLCAVPSPNIETSRKVLPSSHSQDNTTYSSNLVNVPQRVSRSKDIGNVMMNGSTYSLPT